MERRVFYYGGETMSYIGECVLNQSRTTMLLSNVCDFGVQRHTKSTHDFKHSVVARLRTGGKRFIKAFTPQSGILGELSHAPGACNVLDSDKKHVRIFIFQRGSKVFGNDFIVDQVIGSVKWGCFDFHDLLLFQNTRHFLGTLYVALLSRFIAPQQQQIDQLSAAGEIGPIAWAKMNPHLGNTFTHRLAISKVSSLGGTDTLDNTCSPFPIFEGSQPVIKIFRSVKTDHALHRIRKYTFVKQFATQNSFGSNAFDVMGVAGAAHPIPHRLLATEVKQ